MTFEEFFEEARSASRSFDMTLLKAVLLNAWNTSARVEREECASICEELGSQGCADKIRERDLAGIEELE